MDGGTRERAWHFKQLRWSLHRLATSDSAQRALFPEWAASANELALDFDHWTSVIGERYGADLDAVQRTSLAAIEEAFSRMSRDAAELDADNWSDAAVRTSDAWRSLRRLAADALDAFGWPLNET